MKSFFSIYFTHGNNVSDDFILNRKLSRLVLSVVTLFTLREEWDSVWVSVLSSWTFSPPLYCSSISASYKEKILWKAMKFKMPLISLKIYLLFLFTYFTKQKCLGLQNCKKNQSKNCKYWSINRETLNVSNPAALHYYFIVYS